MIGSEQLRSIFARWQRLEEDKAALSEDLKELFAEAKGNGFEPKALRLAFRQIVKTEEAENNPEKAETLALVDLYVDAIKFDADVRLTRASAPARVEIIEKSAAEVKAAVKDREPLGSEHLPSAPKADDAQPEGGMTSGSRAISNVIPIPRDPADVPAPADPVGFASPYMDEDIPADLRRY